MVLETKFNVGDTIYTVEDCAIKERVVSKICIFVYNDRTNISYECDGLFMKPVTEQNAFPNREALLYNLQNS